MKILHFKYRSLGPCESFIERQLRLCLHSREIEAEFLYVRSTPNERTCPIPSSKGWSGLLRLLFRPRKLLPDLIHAHFGSNALLVMIFAWIRRIPLMVSFYGHDVGSFPQGNMGINKMLYQLLFKIAFRVVAMTDSMKQELVRLGCSEQVIVKYFVGVDPLRKRSRGSRKLCNLLMVSSLRPKKNHGLVLKSLARLKELGIILNLRIIGAGPEEKKLKQMARDLLLEEQVCFLGHIGERETLSDHYEWADLMLHPSKRDDLGDQEGLPSSIVEAFSTGVAVILTNHADLKATFLGTGLYIDPVSVCELVESIKTLYRSPQNLTHLEVQSTRFFNENYAHKDYFQALCSLYVTT